MVKVSSPKRTMIKNACPTPSPEPAAVAVERRKGYLPPEMLRPTCCHHPPQLHPEWNNRQSHPQLTASPQSPLPLPSAEFLGQSWRDSKKTQEVCLRWCLPKPRSDGVCLRALHELGGFWEGEVDSCGQNTSHGSWSQISFQL